MLACMAVLSEPSSPLLSQTPAYDRRKISGSVQSFSVAVSQFPEVTSRVKIASSSTLGFPSSLLCLRPPAQWEVGEKSKAYLTNHYPKHLFSLFVLKANKNGPRQLQTVLRLRFHARPDAKSLVTSDATGKLQERND